MFLLLKRYIPINQESFIWAFIFVIVVVGSSCNGGVVIEVLLFNNKFFSHWFNNSIIL